MSLYRRIFKKSLSITWNNKYLWFFGLFAAILGGLGKYELSLNKFGNDLEEGVFPWLASLFQGGILSNITWSGLGTAFKSDPVSMVIILGLVLILLILGVFFVWLSIVSQIGLINNSFEIFKTGKTKSKLGIKDGVEAGIKNFWPVLGVNFIIKTAVYILFLLLAAPLVALAVGPGAQIASLFYVILFIIFIPLALILSLILKYTVCFLVIKEEGFVDSLVKSWKLFLDNWLVSIEMGAILFALQFLLTGALILLMLTLSIPFAFFGLLAAGFSVSAFFLIISLGLLVGIILMFLFGAIFTTFEISSWTGLFLELTGKKNILSKIIRWSMDK
jgi:hypothetical protein